ARARDGRPRAGGECVVGAAPAVRSQRGGPSPPPGGDRALWEPPKPAWQDRADRRMGQASETGLTGARQARESKMEASMAAETSEVVRHDVNCPYCGGV